MNTIEFSREFDLLYNNITSNQAPGLNEYEKSVFLTKAQRQIILESFNVKTDSIGEGFDGGQRRQYDFSNLIQTKVRTQIFDPTVITIDNRSRLFEFPNDWLLSINEVVESNTAGDTLSVTPLNNEEYRKYMSKPYKFPYRSVAWRLINSGVNSSYTTNNLVYGDNKLQFQIKNKIPFDTKVVIKSEEFTEFQKSMAYLIVFVDNISEPSFYQMKIKNTDNVDFVLLLSKQDEECTLKFYFDKDSTVTYDLNDFSYVLNTIKYGLKTFIDSLYPVLDNWGDEIKPVYNAAITLNDVFNSQFYNENYKFSDNINTVTPFINSTVTKKVVELIYPDNKYTDYKIRYVRSPKPIILEDLTNYGSDITIDGETAVRECELPSDCHQEILDRAVLLAKAVWLNIASDKPKTN